jgi:hypothetical protein
VWRIPGERMKMDEDHCVPLSQPALDILGELGKPRTPVRSRRKARPPLWCLLHSC